MGNTFGDALKAGTAGEHQGLALQIDVHPQGMA